MSDKPEVIDAVIRGNGYDGVDAKKVMSASTRGGYNKAEADAPVAAFGPARIPFMFRGSKTEHLDLDPGEFRGQAVPEVTAAIKDILRGIAPDADFVAEDIDFAANEIVGYTPPVVPGYDPDF